MSGLPDYLDRPVRELVQAPAVTLTGAQQERHRIFAHLLMAITQHYWNGNKYGRDVTYPLNPPPEGTPHGARDYLGHNIASIAVDADGHVIDFEFNHNELFNSSIEHAESRMLRRTFALAQIADSWNLNGGSAPVKQYGNLLREVTIYTTLESCSQCSGIMALAQVKEVVYLQRDPGMYFIGNILRNLTADSGLRAPLPISGEEIRFDAYKKLNERYEAYRDAQAKKVGEPFTSRGYSPSVTSFLCTRMAHEVYAEAARVFRDLTADKLEQKDFRPTKTALSNAEALAEARDFLAYATLKGRRGTPH